MHSHHVGKAARNGSSHLIRTGNNAETAECKWLPTYRYIRTHFSLNPQWSQRYFLHMFATMRFDCTKRRRHLPISHTRAKMRLPSYLSRLKYGEHWKTLLQLMEKTLLWRTLLWVSCLQPTPTAATAYNEKNTTTGQSWVSHHQAHCYWFT